MIGATMAAFTDSEYGRLGGGQGEYNGPYFNAQISLVDNTGRGVGPYDWQDTVLPGKRDEGEGKTVSVPLPLIDNNNQLGELIPGEPASKAELEVAFRFDSANSETGHGTLLMRPSDGTQNDTNFLNSLRFTITATQYDSDDPNATGTQAFKIENKPYNELGDITIQDPGLPTVKGIQLGAPKTPAGTTYLLEISVYSDATRGWHYSPNYWGPSWTFDKDANGNFIYPQAHLDLEWRAQAD
jgi:hypothetical protein